MGRPPARRRLTVQNRQGNALLGRQRNVFVVAGFDPTYIGRVMMKQFLPGAAIRWCWLAVLCLPAVMPLGAADALVWNKQQKTVRAEFESADLESVLGKLSKAIGWQIYVEPGTRRKVSVRFKDLPVGEALNRMMGELNFALLPQTNGPAKLFVFQTSLQDATWLVEVGADADERRKGLIPDELVVTLRSGATETIDALARSLGAKIVGKVDGLNTYRLKFANEAAAQSARDALAENPDVAATESNYLVDRPIVADGLELSSPRNFAIKPKLGNPGDNVIVALIDTPVQKLDSKMSEFMLPSVHVAGEPTLPPDELTHGTSMAETILSGLAYSPQESGGSSVRVLPVDVYGNSPDTSTFDVANGIYTALAAGATVVNLSLGGEGDSQLLSGLIQAARQQGVLFFGAAGNQPTTDPTFPAAYPAVIAVTAGDKMGNIAPYANRGSFVDVIGPGVSLVDFQGQSYLVRGTSAATAYVSGAAAGFRASGSAPEEVESHIRQTLGPKPVEP